MKFRAIYTYLFSVAVTMGLFLAACGPEPATPMPTRTPAPTFTPTAELVPTPVDPAAVATADALAATQAAAANAAAPAPDQGQNSADAAPLPPDTPTPEPPPAVAEAVVNSAINVRGGPGTNYNIIGGANAGERFRVTGRNQDGTWWQVDYNGQAGWLFAELITPVNTETVAVAQNIPAPPPPTAVPPTATPQPPPQPQEPPPTPKPNYLFSRALLQKCDPNAGVTYVEGTVYKDSNPVNGYFVAFSYAPDGPQVAKIEAGPHDGYPGWRTGFYSHILSPNGPREGDWYFWVEDSSGRRVSDIAHVHTDGSAGDGKCQQAVIDFDS